jgi:hypothetical protein
MIPVEGAADERQSVTNALTLLPVDETPSQNSSINSVRSLVASAYKILC